MARSGKLWKRGDSTTIAMDGRNGAARRDDSLEWEVGKQPERTFPTSYSCVCDGWGCSVSAGWGEWGFGVIVFGCGEVAGTITRNEARGRTGCAD